MSRQGWSANQVASRAAVHAHADTHRLIGMFIDLVVRFHDVLHNFARLVWLLDLLLEREEELGVIRNWLWLLRSNRAIWHLPRPLLRDYHLRFLAN